jgi:beta-galactosidase
VPGLEAATRVAPDGTRLLFLLNHNAEPVQTTARDGGVDLLRGDRVEPGQPIRLDPRGVLVLRETT